VAQWSASGSGSVAAAGSGVTGAANVAGMRQGLIAEVTGGDLIGPDLAVRGRPSTVELTGSAFVPVIDVRDGHDFIAAAIERAPVSSPLARSPVRTSTSPPSRWSTRRGPDRFGRHARQRIGAVLGFAAVVGHRVGGQTTITGPPAPPTSRCRRRPACDPSTTSSVCR
jgi:hypothetical protein